MRGRTQWPLRLQERAHAVNRAFLQLWLNQLRDPAIFEEDGRIYLLYAVAGESGIAIAEVLIDE